MLRLGGRLVAIVLSLPIIAVGASLLTPAGDIWAHLLKTTLPTYITDSFLLGIGAVFFAALIGGGSAVIFSLYQFPGKRWLEWAMILPFAFPVYIVAYAYGDMFSYGGWAYQASHNTLGLVPDVRSLGGAILLFGLNLYPYVYLLVRATLRQQSEHLLEISQTLGISRLQAIRKWIIPMIRPALVAGCVLVLMETLSDYAAVQYLGVNTFSVGIFRTWYGLGSLSGAAQMSLLLLSLAIVLIALERGARKRLRYYNTGGKDTSFSLRTLHGWKAAVVSIGSSLPVILGFIVPLIQLMLWLSLEPGFASYGRYLHLIGNTLSLAIGSALLVTAIALLLAYSEHLKEQQRGSWLNRIATMGYGVPGIIIAIGVLLLAMQLKHVGILVSGSLLLLYFAYVVRFMTPGFHALESSLLKISPNIRWVALTLGIRKMQKLYKLYVPLMRPGFVAALILVFVDVVKEVPAALVLRPFDFTTLAIHAHELAESENLSALGMPSLILVLVGSLPLFILWGQMDLKYKLAKRVQG